MLTPSGSMFQYNRNMPNKPIGEYYHISLEEIHKCCMCTEEDSSPIMVYPVCLHRMHFHCWMDATDMNCPACHNNPTPLMKMLVTRTVSEIKQSEKLRQQLSELTHIQDQLYRKETELNARELLLSTNERTFAEESRKLKRKKNDMIDESRQMVKDRLMLKRKLQSLPTK